MILLFDRTAKGRTVTPIIKQPRPAHLRLDQAYPVVLATLYPDQAPVVKRSA